MGFSFHATGCVKRAKESWNESHTINGSVPTAKTKEKPAGVNRRITGLRRSDPSGPNERYRGRFGGLWRAALQERDDKFPDKIQDRERIGGVIRQLAYQHQRLAPSPVGFPWRLLFQAITVMFGGKTRNTSATEEIRVSI